MLPPPPPALVAQTPAQAPVPAPKQDFKALAEQAVKADDLAQAELYCTLALVDAPDDEELLFLAGRVASWRGKHANAVHYLAPLVASHPANADYRAALGRAYFYNEDRLTALTHLDRARVLAPRDWDVWALEIRLLEELGGANAAAAEALRAQMRQRFPGRALPQPHEPLVSPGRQSSEPPPAAPVLGTVEPEWIAQAGGEFESLSRGYAPWYGATLAFGRQWSPTKRWMARVRETSRFDLPDTEAGLAGTWPLHGPMLGSFDVSLSPTNQVLPLVSVMGALGLTLDPWAAELRFRAAAYRLAFVPATTLSVERYIGPFRAGYALTLTRAPDATLPLVHTASASWYPTDAHSLTLGGSFGEEVEAVAPQRVARTDTRSVFANGRVGLPEGWALLPELAYIDQTAFFSRYRAQVAVEKRF